MWDRVFVARDGSPDRFSLHVDDVAFYFRSVEPAVTRNRRGMYTGAPAPQRQVIPNFVNKLVNTWAFHFPHAACTQ